MNTNDLVRDLVVLANHQFSNENNRPKTSFEAFLKWRFSNLQVEMKKSGKALSFEGGFPQLLVDILDVYDTSMEPEVVKFRTDYEEEMKWRQKDPYPNLKRRKIMLDLAFRLFVEKVHADGMFDMIDKAEVSKMAGTFGSTKLLTLMAGGRLVYTFSQNDNDLTYASSDDDRLALDAVLQSSNTDLLTACQMLREVIENWPSDRKKRAEMFVIKESIQVI